MILLINLLTSFKRLYLFLYIFNNSKSKVESKSYITKSYNMHLFFNKDLCLINIKFMQYLK
jgi:hypothetical protein